MARLLADENFPLPAVEALRGYAHDVATLADLERAGRRVSDADVLALAAAEQRAVLTLNRRAFFRLHREAPSTPASWRARSIRISRAKPREFTRH